MQNKGSNPLSKLLAWIGPGLFLIGYNIGTGSVTTMASAGSRWGMSLTWTLVLSCLFTFIAIYAFGKYTLVTGDTILYAIKRHLPLGRLIGIFILCTLSLAEIAGIAGLMAIVVDLLQEWIKYGIGYQGEWAKFVLTASLSAMVFVIMWRGSYQYLEKVLSILVSVMGLCFVATALLVVPEWRKIIAGLVPAVPREQGASLIVAGMAGTTFSSAVFYCRSIIIKAKGWGLREEKRAWFDAFVSVVSMLILSIAIMICAAGTLYVVHKPVEEAVDMVRTLEPLAGKFAISIFIIGILGAGLSSLIPTALIAPWLISDYTNTKTDPKSNISRTFVIICFIICLSGPYINVKPVLLMIVTMALLAVIVPVSTISITILLNQKQMGEHKNSALMNVACIGVIIFSVAMSYYGVISLTEFIREKFG